MNFVSLFSGGGGADLGAHAAGLVPLWGIEYDDAIASVARSNHLDIQTADVRAMDYAALPRAGWLHASPPCINASQANANSGETALDMALAVAVICAIVVQRPAVFSLENVIAYRHFAAFRLIVDCLEMLDYEVAWWHLNAADYGVPQTRRRLILVASRVHTPCRPAPTHYDASAGHQHMLYQPWIGWYAAIEDLLPMLPDSQLAAWQLKRLPAELRESVLVSDQLNADTRTGDQPALTVMANRAPRCLLVHATDQRSLAVPHPLQPAFTVMTTNHGVSKAVLVGGPANQHGMSVTHRAAGQPAMTVTGSSGQRHADRAVLIGGGNTNMTEDRDRPVRDADSPAFTQTASSGRDRAMFGRVVRMTPRCVARFQSFPDSYVLPDRVQLACRIIGNAVPPLLMQRIIEAQEINND